jgi:hypothetical protein
LNKHRDIFILRLRSSVEQIFATLFMMRNESLRLISWLESGELCAIIHDTEGNPALGFRASIHTNIEHLSECLQKKSELSEL